MTIEVGLPDHDRQEQGCSDKSRTVVDFASGIESHAY